MGDVTGEATPNKIISTKDHEYRRWTDGTLPNRQDLGSHINDSIFGAGALANPLPKYRFPASENRPEEIFRVVSDELYLDGNARQNLSTFCQTWDEPELLDLMAAIDKNMIDKDEYSADRGDREPLRQHPRGPMAFARKMNMIGTSTTGTSEACMLGGMAMKRRWRARRGLPASRPTGRT